MHLSLVIFGLLFAAAVSQAQDVKEIVRKAIGREVEHQKQLANYTWQTRSVTNIKGSDSKSKTFDNFNIDGTSYKKLVEKDGKPLSASEARDEQARMDKEMAKRRAESESQRSKRLAEERRDLEDRIRFRNEVMQAFTFQLEGEETIDGHRAYRIRADQRPDFQPQSKDGKHLAKVKGRIWVGKDSGEWLKFEMETTDKITWGAFLASISPGSRIVAQQMRINDTLWHPQWVKITANARALWKHIDANIDIAYQNFRKFQADSTFTALAGAAN